MSAGGTMYREWLVVLGVPLLGGCPFVFSGPDLSNVDASPDASGTGDTGPQTTGPFDAPDVVSLTGRRALDFLRLEVELFDEDYDLVGGSVELSSSEGDTLSLKIPDDISRWQADGVSS